MKGSLRFNFTAILVVIGFLLLAGMLVYGLAVKTTQQVEEKLGSRS